jgi:hypothetical protein
VRRLLWNLYAWPITILLVALYPSTIASLGTLGVVDVLFSAPSLVALHAHVWDKRVLGSMFWKPYAFALAAWDVVLNVLLAPRVTHQELRSTDLLGVALLLPLYVAVFRYAFRQSTVGRRASGSRQIWICPQCQRHVPTRLPACRCGFTRESATDIRSSSRVTADPAAKPRGSYVKAKLWDKPCPRCHHPSSVDLYLLSPVWRVGFVLTALATLAIAFSNAPSSPIVRLIAPLLSVLGLKFGSRAECYRCGARLHRTLTGWG